MASTNQFSSVLAIDDVSIASMKLNTSTDLDRPLLTRLMAAPESLFACCSALKLGTSQVPSLLMVRKAAFFVQL